MFWQTLLLTLYRCENDGEYIVNFTLCARKKTCSCIAFSCLIVALPSGKVLEALFVIFLNKTEKLINDF